MVRLSSPLSAAIVTGALLLVAAPGRADAEALRLPVRARDVTVSAYFDHDGQDWGCGELTYEGHRGTDFMLVGGFDAMDAGVPVFAAAPGEIVVAHDGEYDRCTTGDCVGGQGMGNHLALRHPDGSLTWYAHLKQGSLLYGVGDLVLCGQQIAMVGSSGHSTGPHLHLEVIVDAVEVDPFAGPCGSEQSAWLEQGEYLSLPSEECWRPPPAPDLQLATLLSVPADRSCGGGDGTGCADLIRDGASDAVTDAWVGDTLVWRISLTNMGDQATSGGSDEGALELAYELPPSVTALRWSAEVHSAEGWGPSGAVDDPRNPPGSQPPAEGSLHLAPIEAGGAARVMLVVSATAPLVGADGDERPNLRAWIRQMSYLYGPKESWDSPPEVNEGQEFNGGELRVQDGLDVFDPTAFLFGSPDPEQLEGWRRCEDPSTDGLAVDVQQGALVLADAGGTPCLESPPLSLVADELPVVRVVLAHAAGPADGWLDWTTIEQPEWGPDQAVALSTAGDGEPEELLLEPGWFGTLTRLRIRPWEGSGRAGRSLALGEVSLLEPGEGEDGADAGVGEPDAGTDAPPPGGGDDDDEGCRIAAPHSAGPGLGDLFRAALGWSRR